MSMETSMSSGDERGIPTSSQSIASTREQSEGFDSRAVSRELNALHERRQDFYVDVDAARDPFYVLGMFPYPSGNAHMGHVRVYTITDAVTRFERQHGRDVLNPIGWDAFGLPAENAAIKYGVEPRAWTLSNIQRMREEQFAHCGWAVDWTKEINTCSPEYYRQTQRIFLELLKKDLAYQKEGLVNWDPIDQTVLANEQVIDGKSWRSGALVEKRFMKQWHFRVTAYAQRLWDDLAKLTKWPHAAVAIQRNWIQRSDGHRVDFPIKGANASIEIYTDRLDTLYGVSAILLTPEHPTARELAKQPGQEAIAEFIEKALKRSSVDRLSSTEKHGVLAPMTVCHPLSGVELPVYIADYRLGDYATGAFAIVPAHNEQDAQFAAEMGLAVPKVLESALNNKVEASANKTVLVNSGPYSGLLPDAAQKAISAALAERELGRPSVEFNLHDWSVGRQRLWGCPIPIVYCDACGVVPVPDDQLPIVLPEKISLKNGKADLASDEQWVHTSCPCCSGPARRETDTLDTFVCSSWYAFRFLDPHNDGQPFSSTKVNRWGPISLYVGGLEHAAQHMLYYRFLTKVFNDLGLINFDEPVDEFFCNGLVLLNGEKMSKSKGNVVVPTEIIERYGADALRLYILSDTPADQDIEWNDAAVGSKSRFVKSMHSMLDRYLSTVSDTDQPHSTAMDRDVTRQFYGIVGKLERSLRERRFHNGVAFVHEMSAVLKQAIADVSAQGGDPVRRAALRPLVRDYLTTCSVFMPYMTESLFERYFAKGKESIFAQGWPTVDLSTLTAERITIPVQIDGKKRGTISIPSDATEAEVLALVQTDAEMLKFLSATPKQVVYRAGKILSIVS